MSNKYYVFLIAALIIILLTPIVLIGTAKVYKTYKINKIMEKVETKNENKIPIVIYKEELMSTETETRLWPTIRIWQKSQNTDSEILVDKIGKINEYPLDFMLSPDNKTLLINLESKLIALDIKTKSFKDLLMPKKEIGSYQFSPDSKKLLIWDQKYASTDYEYYVHEYDFETGSQKILHQGNTDEKYFSIRKWRDDNIVLLQQAGGEVVISWYFDLNSGKLTQSPNAGSNVDYASKTGKYIVLANKFVNDACNDKMGSAPSIYKIQDPVTGKVYGNFGIAEKMNYLVAFSPDNKEVLFSSEEPPAARDVKSCTASRKEKYFRSIIGSNSAAMVGNHIELLKSWLPNSPYVKISYEKEKPLIYIDGELFSNKYHDLITAYYISENEAKNKTSIEPFFCTQTPALMESGRLIYPINPKYEKLRFLGQLFTAADCGEERLQKIPGVEGGKYTFGSTIWFKYKLPLYTIRLFKDIGFECTSEDCKEWELKKSVEVKDLLKLKPYYYYIEVDDCVNCG